MTGSLTRTGNRIGVWMFRRLNGRMSSGSKKVHVLMITTPGRRTGILVRHALSTPSPRRVSSSGARVGVTPRPGLVREPAARDGCAGPGAAAALRGDGS